MREIRKPAKVGAEWARRRRPFLVGTGPNHPVTPASLEKAAGADTLDALARETGIARDELLRRLTAELPHDVDKLTPQGRIPSEDEASV